MQPVFNQKTYALCQYDLESTLDSGQTFRWHRRADGWVGVIEDHWIRATQKENRITFQTSHPSPDWDRIETYFQIKLDIRSITSRFPSDPHLKKAVKRFPGLRLLRQSPWECLASFILSSSKQIVHIKQIVERLSNTFGKPLIVPEGFESSHQFPDAECLSQASESDLRKLGMGYRAAYLRASAQRIARGEIDLELSKLSYCQAKKSLQQFPGVGPKIADCVLLFAFGFQEAFPIDVWMRRALRELYFSNQHASIDDLQKMAADHFKPFCGYAQQYLFHATRSRKKKNLS